MITAKIYEKIRKADIITIFGHVMPDGDCYGSQLGLKEAIKATFLDKQVYILGTGLPRFFADFAEMDNVEDKTIAQSLALVLDVANFERIEDQRYKLAQDIIKIDHHIFANEFGSVEWIDTSSAAAAQMITEFIIEQKMKISKLGAEALFLGIVTDSGRFQYSSTSDRTFAAASFLLAQGINLKRIYDALYIVEEKDLRFKGYVYENYKTCGGVAYIKIPLADSLKYEVTPDYAGGQVNLIANIKGFPIWAAFAEREDGTVRVELRSSGISVQPVAVKFGGGGHRQASGCRIAKLEESENVVEELIAAIAKGE